LLTTPSPDDSLKPLSRFKRLEAGKHCLFPFPQNKVIGLDAIHYPGCINGTS
jgi:hypothetical protein